MEKHSIGNSQRRLLISELEENLAALYPWNLREFEIPDVIAFKDFVHSRRSIAESLFASQRTVTWGRALRFPYPNGSKLREFVVLDAPDPALLRASAGRIARPVEQRLSNWSFGYRTTPDGAAWSFNGTPSERWRHFTDSAIRLLQRGDLNAMCSTDVAKYYPSIELHRLEACLHELGCDLDAIAVLLSGFRKWASVDGTSGLPIGPEASKILGNAFLIPIDRMLMSLGIEYVRWMDDYKLLGPDEPACRRMEYPFDQFLSTQGLTRSIEKTKYYPNAFAAISGLKDGRLASLGYWLDSGVDWASDALRTAFEREIAEEGAVSPSRFRFILRTLKNRADDFAADSIANNSELASIDPKMSGEYLALVGLAVQPVLDAMFTQLRGEPTDERDALDLHFLRALAQKPRGWGADEGRVFESIAGSDSRRPPVRCWAIHAFSRTSRWSQGSMMESAEAEADPLVRRIKVTTLTKVRAGRKRNHFLQHMCARYPELTPTARWLEAS